MASIRHKGKKSQYYYACFLDALGVQRQCSTKTTDRKLAQRIADELEASYVKKRTTAQLRKTLEQVNEQLDNDGTFSVTFRAHCQNWLNEKRLEVVPGTYKRYAQIVRDILQILGPVADFEIDRICKDHVLQMREEVADRVRVGTANYYVKVLRALMRAAVVNGLRLDNPACQIKLAKVTRVPGEEKRPFSDDELRRLKAVLTGEWPLLVMMGEHTGQRLGDIASATFGQFDLQARFWTFFSQKTQRDMRVPLTDALLQRLQALPSGTGNAPVFPIASKARRDVDGESRVLSNQFYHFLVSAGLVHPRSKKNTGLGHGRGRKTNPLSFHSLRHNATSHLKKAGVPEAIVRDIIGHESELVSRKYTHIDDDSKLAAMRRVHAA